MIFFVNIFFWKNKIYLYFWKLIEKIGILVAITQILVVGVLSQATANPLEFGDHRRQLVDSGHLLLEEVALEEVAEMGVITATTDSVKIQECLCVNKKEEKYYYLKKHTENLKIFFGAKVNVGRTWFTVLSSSNAAMTASSGPLHSSWVGLAICWRTTLPPRLFWYFMNFSACSRSSSEHFLKNLKKPGRATSSRSK